DALVVRFDRAFVDAGDGLRGKSLLLFRRAFGDRQKPIEGTPLYAPTGGAADIPETFAVDANPSAFERQIWAEFWTLANDPTRATARGVRVGRGEAPHVRAIAGRVYKLPRGGSGGLGMVPRIPAAALPK